MWVWEPAWTCWRWEKSLATAGNWTLNCSAHGTWTALHVIHFQITQLQISDHCTVLNIHMLLLGKVVATSVTCIAKLTYQLQFIFLFQPVTLIFWYRINRWNKTIILDHMSVICPKSLSPYLTLQWVTYKIDSPKACVCITRVEGLKAVRKVVLTRCSGKTRGTVCSTTLWSVPRTNNGIGHHQWDVVRISPTTTLNSNCDVCKWYWVITHSNLRTCKTVSVVIPNCIQKR